MKRSAKPCNGCAAGIEAPQIMEYKVLTIFSDPQRHINRMAANYWIFNIAVVGGYDAFGKWVTGAMTLFFSRPWQAPQDDLVEEPVLQENGDA